MLTVLFLLRLIMQTETRGLMFWVTAGLYVLLIACGAAGKWNIFRKADRTPWHSLIPVISSYELYDICWDGRFGLAEGALYLVMLMRMAGTGSVRQSCLPDLFVLFCLYFVLSVIMKRKLSKSFGRSVAFTYGLLFAEGIFCCALGFSKSGYLGKTLRKYNPKTVREAKGERGKRSRQYMISLQRSRSMTGLFACLMTFALCMFAVAGGLIENPSDLTPERGDQLFKLFTVNSNFFSAIGAAVMIPYAVEGFRKKRFSYPKWVQLLQYSGAICTTLTMLFAIFLIFPALGAKIAFGRMNFWLHAVCPIMTLILLFSVETDLELSVNDALLCLTPFFAYAAVYIVKVVLIGEENGGWRDIYRLTKFIPPALSAPMMFMLGFGVAQGIRILYNRVSRTRQKQMQHLWAEDLSPVEIKIEVYGLGRYTGMHDEINNITVPFDIFYDFAKRYDVTPEELARAFNKGVIDGLKERSEYMELRRKRLGNLFGTPEKLRKDKEGETS